MKKKIIIAISIIIGVTIVYYGYGLATTKSHSPAAKATYSNNGLNININYCQPYKKGRLIFGEASQKALQPYGKYWRVGANEATTFDVNKDILVNGQELKAGKYQLYSVPGKDKWEIYFNSEWDRWGAMEANHKTDVLKTEVAADNNAAFEEQLIVSFDSADSVGKTNLNIHWDKTLIKIPLSVK